MHCNHVLAWYDLIPVISWILLRGKCRYCQGFISFLYPFIELSTGIVLTGLLIIAPPHYWSSYLLLFTGLIIASRTDLETYLIPTHVTIYLIPFALIFAHYNYLPITLKEGVIGSFSAAAFLWLFAAGYEWLTGKKGMGEGDVDLLAMIGAFTGLSGWWFALTTGSVFATIFGILLYCTGKANRTTRLPFGPFLAIGAIIYVCKLWV
jgi:leader peptidase (prepilin peptidase)/N-methyltransferase